MSADDEILRSLGTQAGIAIEVVNSVVWARSVEIMRQAEELADNKNLTPERAQALLIALVEQRKVSSGLHSQIRDGIKAARRIDTQMEAAAKAKEAEKRAATHGINRFVNRSKVG